MYRCYPLKGLNKPNSCTLLETARDEFFNASFGGENYEALWKFCENHWKDEELMACISFDSFDSSGIPVNAAVKKVLPKSEQRVVDLGLV